MVSSDRVRFVLYDIRRLIVVLFHFDQRRYGSANSGREGRIAGEQILKRRASTRACISGPRPPDYRLQGFEVVLQGLGTLFG